MSARRGVLWFGPSPRPATQSAFTERGLALTLQNLPPAPADWATAKGVVFAMSDGGDGEYFVATYRKSFRTALSHGLMVIILADLERVPSISHRLRSLKFGYLASLQARNRENTIAETIARSEEAAAWSGNVTVSGDSDLCVEDNILVRRAFGNCVSVVLVREPGGHSAKVFRAYVRLGDSRVGPHPLPFFVKLDRYPKIARELANYRECTTLFVPFNQRPNLDLARCALGAFRGIIVGNFIEESESLRELVGRGTARAAIHSLFASALRGWRSQAH